MAVFIVAVTATPADGVPLWVTVLGIALAGLAVPIFQYLTKRLEGRTGKGVADATAKQIDSAVVDAVVLRLRTENERLYKRLDDLFAQGALRPTKDELFDRIGKLQAQLRSEGIIPLNGPVSPPVPMPLPDPSKG